jgi:hypothetical protein
MSLKDGGEEVEEEERGSVSGRMDKITEQDCAQMAIPQGEPVLTRMS